MTYLVANGNNVVDEYGTEQGIKYEIQIEKIARLAKFKYVLVWDGNSNTGNEIPITTKKVIKETKSGTEKRTEILGLNSEIYKSSQLTQSVILMLHNVYRNWETLRCPFAGAQKQNSGWGKYTNWVINGSLKNKFTTLLTIMI